MDVEKTPFPWTEYLELHRQLGLARGLMSGWLYWDGTKEHKALLERVTREYLEKSDGR